MTPMKIIYISGRYRHYFADSSFNLPLMQGEIALEAEWAGRVARCGHMWIAPLANSLMVEQANILRGDEFVHRDLELISCLPPSRTIFLVRPCMEGESEDSMGVLAEMECARERGIEVARADWQDADDVEHYLRELHNQGME